MSQTAVAAIKIGTYDSLLIFYARLDMIKLLPCALRERPRSMYMAFWETNEMGWQVYIKGCDF